MQALVTMVLEPQWEARFETNVYGFRPGRSVQDAIAAIFLYLRVKPKYALDADIEKCFDQIDHEALLGKLHVAAPIRRLVRDWLKTGILEDGEMSFPEAGTPQGGVISPLLANIALHGLEIVISAVSRKHKVTVIRYADDLVLLCDDLPTLEVARARLKAWLAEIGLRLKDSKTYVTHTLDEHEGRVGFDFLGFQIRQHRVGKHHTKTYRGIPGMKTLIKPSPRAVKRHIKNLNTLVREQRGAPQAGLISKLNTVIRGWTNYYRASVAKRTFGKADQHLYSQLRSWARWRHPKKASGWQYRRYWKRRKTSEVFTDGTSQLVKHAATPIVRHIKVQGNRSPYDGDWVYWGQRLQRDPTKPNWLLRMLKQQNGQCEVCGLHFMANDVIEEHHRDGNHTNHRLSNRVLLHGHCHDQLHGAQCL
jgi:RNA-directed DNA polymerase